MRLLLTALIVALGAGGALAAETPEVPQPIRDKGYAIVKDWDFGRTIRTPEDLRREFHTRFVYEGGRLDYLPANGEWQRYGDNDTHRLVGDELQLVAHLRHGMKDGGIESGMLRSKWTGKYGYYEIRMKVPPGRGMWPAFWLNPEDQKWPPEIDVVEIVNNGRDTTRNSFHNLINGNRSEKVTALQSKLDRWGSWHPSFDYKDGFHRFAVEWTPDTVRHYVDDVLLVERPFKWVHDGGADGGPAHVLVNLAVGGKWPEPPKSESDFPAILHIDWIRVWQKKG